MSSGGLSYLHFLMQLKGFSLTGFFVLSWFLFFTCHFVLVSLYKLALLEAVMGRYVSICYYKFTILLKFSLPLSVTEDPVLLTWPPRDCTCLTSVDGARLRICIFFGLREEGS